MEPVMKAYCDEIAQLVIAGDHAALHGRFAPWLQKSLPVPALQEMLESAAADSAVPVTWTADTGLAGLEDLRVPDGLSPPSKGLPKEISAANYQGWYSIQFAPAEDDEYGNVCFDVWLALVKLDGALMIGYLEPAEPS